MFERYTETARKAIFVARFEASQFGSEYIETEHLLLGILRVDGPLAMRLIKAPASIESIREQVEKQFVRREKISTSVDLPLSHECKRALAYGAEEAERLNHKNIATEHLFLGLLREKDCTASKVMVENGVTASKLKQEVARLTPAGTPAATPGPAAPRIAGSRDLTAAAGNAALGPVDWTRTRTGPRHSDPVAENQKQPGADRRAWRGEKRDRTRSGAADRRWRRARHPFREAHSGN